MIYAHIFALSLQLNPLIFSYKLTIKVPKIRGQNIRMQNIVKATSYWELKD